MRLARLVRPAIQEIAVQRHDYAGRIEFVSRLERTAERGHRSRIAMRPARRRMGVPNRLGHGDQHRVQLRDEARRCQRPRHDVQTFALPIAQLGELAHDLRPERLPRRRPVQLADRLRPQRIIQVEHARLHPDVGAAPAPRVIRIAFHLQRPRIARRHHDPVGDPVLHRKRRVIDPRRGLDAQRVVHIRHFLRPPVWHVVAAGQARHRERGGHQP